MSPPPPSQEVRKCHQVPWNWSWGWLWNTQTHTHKQTYTHANTHTLHCQIALKLFAVGSAYAGLINGQSVANKWPRHSVLDETYISVLSLTHQGSAGRLLQKRGQKDRQSHRERRRVVKCCTMAITLLLHSWAHCNCGYLPNTCIRLSQTKFQHVYGRGPGALSSDLSAVYGCWGQVKSYFFGSVTTGSLPKLHWIAPYLYARGHL